MTAPDRPGASVPDGGEGDALWFAGGLLTHKAAG